MGFNGNVLSRDTTDKTSSSQTTEAIPVKNRKVVHEKTDFYGRDFERQITISAIFRSLKYNGGCRDDTNDIAAVFPLLSITNRYLFFRLWNAPMLFEKILTLMPTTIPVIISSGECVFSAFDKCEFDL